VIAALELDRRLTRTGHAVAYLVVTLPVALLALPAVALLILGAALSVAGIGLPLLLAGAAACRGLVRFDRRAANRWLDAQVPPLPRPAGSSPLRSPGRLLGPGSSFRQSLDLLSDRGLWRIATHLAVRPLLEVTLLAVALLPLFALALVLQLGIEGIAGVDAVDYIGPWALGPVLGVILLALVPPAAALTIATLEALYRVLCVITHAFLSPRALPGGPVREMLAESLGDRTVSVAYWLPDRGRFVDELGRPVTLPRPGSGRAWTAVERDGRRVAAIIHDAALDTSRELVEAAAAASSLAIDNERLKADLQARVEELRVSRLRIMEAGDAARRRIERNLHDGAQQQLVALALELRMLKARLKDPEAGPMIDDLSERLAAALAELRELARGIHPAILTDRGLAPAISALAERGSVPIECSVAVGERLPAPVEAAAYFLVAEALTNVARYAHASSARVEVRRDGGEVVVLVADDGVGGVDPDAGTGLRGLEDRVAAVGGTLEIESPVGGGTRLRARIPAPEPEPEDGSVAA
jgi:signal transduction histidine kinase